VPTNKEIAELTRRVEQLTASVQKLSGGRAEKKAVPARKRVRATSRAAA
jgi:cell division protein FtsB